MLLMVATAGLLGWKANQVSTERRIEAELRAAGAFVERSKPSPAWLAPVLGLDYVTHVEVVGISASHTLDIPNRLPATDEHLRALGQLPRLRVLRLGSSRCTAEGLRHLAASSTLVDLVAIGIELDETGWKALGGLKHLKSIDLETRSSAKGWQALLELEELESLQIRCAQGDPPDLDALETAVRSRMKQLGWLEIRIGDANVVWEPGSTQLRDGLIEGYPVESP